MLLKRYQLKRFTDEAFLILLFTGDMEDRNRFLTCKEHVVSRVGRADLQTV